MVPQVRLIQPVSRLLSPNLSCCYSHNTQGEQSSPFFSSMNQHLFEKNWQRLLQLNPRLLDEDSSKLQEKKDIAFKFTKSDEQEFWRSEFEHKALTLPQWIPRGSLDNDDNVRHAFSYKLGDNIDQYRNKNSEDPHLVQALFTIRSTIENVGFDPAISATVACQPTNTMISLGTGTGLLLNDMIESLNPYNLLVIVSEWSDLISSFYTIDWGELARRFGEDQDRSISFERVKSKPEMVNALLKMGLATTDLATVLAYPSTESHLIHNLKELVDERAIQNCLTYTGFTVDEYNMVVNTVETLYASPLIYEPPKSSIGGGAVVCGSGPSLDSSLAVISHLQETHVIIAGGSNYRSLRKASIRVDYLLLNERSIETYDDYASVIQEFGEDECVLVMSSTCPSRLTELFKATVVYYRPALTPLSLFATSEREVLSFEGPESVNTATSFAASIGIQRIALFGVDLGTATLSKARSIAAAGETPRTFEITAKGNLTKTVHTTRTLQDTRIVIERLIMHYSDVDFYNCSNGVFIQGAEPCDPSSYLAMDSQNIQDISVTKKKLDDWLSSLRTYSKRQLITSWQARSPRKAIAGYCNSIISALQEDQKWFPSVLKHIDNNNMLGVSLKMQIPRRLWRSSVLKVVVAITQQLHIMKAQDEWKLQMQLFEKCMRSYLIDYLRALEKEGYSLCDTIDALLSASPSKSHD